MTRSQTIAGILAGGSGSRFGASIPKQYIEYKGKMVIQHCLERFQEHPEIDTIVVAASPEWQETIWELKQIASLSKITNVVDSGTERYHSSIAIIESLDNETDRLLLHDAARAFCSTALISRVILALQSHKAVSVGLSCTDTVMQITEDNFIHQIPNRTQMRLVQTPQGFELGTIKQAYQLALQDSKPILTDDCSAILRYQPSQKIHVVEGEPENIKLTFPTDLK